ncbi:MAG: RNA pseudouridine synthase [Bdellovibrionaceae bacterium]|nr:RNA pseudouridine synthase [Bdellovibrio sp.]
MIQILEENEFFIVLIKPPGFSVHNQSPSLVEYLQKMKKPIHFVNRLDQETSGLVIVAKKPEYHQQLAESLEEGTKQYRALLRGPWKKTEKTVTWAAPLTDQAEGRKNPKGLSVDRLPCTTLVEVVRTNAYFTEIKAELLTGRQHQIRKHAAIAGYPIVGDNRYNESKYNKGIADKYGISRSHLHAEMIEFEFENKKYIYKNMYNLDPFFKEPKNPPTPVKK